MPSLKRRIADGLGRAIGAHLIPYGGTDAWIERRFLGNLLRALRVDCVFDVGANKGQFGNLLRTSGFRGRILSFEPGPAAFMQLQEVAKGDDKWHTFNLALGEKEATLPLNVMKVDVFSSFRTPTQDEDASFSDDNQVDLVFDVEVKRIEDIYDDLAVRFDFHQPFLKMDTQGFDLEVIRGSGEKLKRFSGLSSEISVRRLYNGSPSMAESIQEINRSGFDFVNLIPVHPDRILNPLELNSYAVRRSLVDLLGPR